MALLFKHQLVLAVLWLLIGSTLAKFAESSSSRQTDSVRVNTKLARRELIQNILHRRLSPRSLSRSKSDSSVRVKSKSDYLNPPNTHQLFLRADQQQPPQGTRLRQQRFHRANPPPPINIPIPMDFDANLDVDALLAQLGGPPMIRCGWTPISNEPDNANWDRGPGARRVIAGPESPTRRAAGAGAGAGRMHTPGNSPT